MKNLHLLAISVGMSIGSAAMAEPSVTLYGILDGGVSVSKLQHQSAKVQMTNGNWLSNRWGLMGQEDLGGGNSVFFKLEQGFNLSNGSEATAGKAFNRETALGLSGEWGKLGLGRFGGLSSDCGTFSILGGAAYSTSFSTIGNMHGAFYLTDRYNNSVAYVTPDFVGLQGHLMYSNGTDSDEEKWSQNSHYYGAGLTYNKDKLSVDVIYELLDHKGAVDQDKTRLLNLGASYDFGAFKLFGAYEYAQHAALPGIEFAEEKMSEAYNAGKANNYHAFSLSTSVKAFGGDLMVQGQYVFGKNKNSGKLEEGWDKKFNAYSIGAGYLYNISKRTLVYVQGAWGKANKALNLAPGLSGWNTSLGVMHRF